MNARTAYDELSLLTQVPTVSAALDALNQWDADELDADSIGSRYVQDLVCIGDALKAAEYGALDCCTSDHRQRIRQALYASMLAVSLALSTRHIDVECDKRLAQSLAARTTVFDGWR